MSVWDVFHKLQQRKTKTFSLHFTEIEREDCKIQRTLTMTFVVKICIVCIYKKRPGCPIFKKLHFQTDNLGVNLYSFVEWSLLMISLSCFSSVTRLDDLLYFGQLFKACGNH